MSRFNFKLMILCCCAVLASSASAQDEKKPDQNPQSQNSIFGNFLPFVGTTVSPSLTLPGFHGVDPFTELDGTATLHRSATGIGYTYSARNLQPNSSYTNWFVAFNNPKSCFTPCACGLEDLENPAANVGVYYATGRVSDAYRQAIFMSETDYGELPTGDDQVPFDLLTTAVKTRAEVHLVIRTHGLAAQDEGLREDQLTSFNKGCGPDGCVDQQVSVHRSPTCFTRGRRLRLN
ncbi:MAG: hypothetical protein V3V30_00655 [Parvularculaceae bacterium]